MTYTVGQSYSGFTLKEFQHIEEIRADVYLFQHDFLQCPLFAIKNNDVNKTFTVAFNTIPADSTGVAHILEHSVLMGSKKYPIKDVFGEINKGGLTTFLNAMTGADITYYPFATRNLKEYFNIMDVYCDVVFHPLLKKTTFEQEGWRYHKESDDAAIQFQGVVYNEMKGAFSDPVRLIFHHIFGGLMPGSTYAHESGGDPKNIPDLSYEQFCEFHKHHYHPSNGTFFVYGDANLDEELEFLQNRFLRHFKNKEKRRTIEAGQLAEEITFIEDSYGVESSDTTGKTFIAVGTSVSTVQNKLQNAAFQIIANILYNSDGSPLKNSIVSSGLCKDFGGFYLSSSSFRTFMTSYMVGSDPEKKDDFLQLYNSTLATMVEQGLERDLVVAELNKFEFATREDASKSQRGLDLIGKAMSSFKYNTDPFENLTNEELIHNVRKKALEEGYFEKLIQQYLLDNQATVVVTLRPDPKKGAAIQEREQTRLDQYTKTLNEVDQQKLVGRTKELMGLQLSPNSEETLTKLPKLGLSDLPSKVDFHAVQPTEMFDQEVLVSSLETNRICYIDIGFDLSAVPVRLLPWLDLFGTIITEIGTEKLDYMQFAKEIATCTGNLSHSVNTYVKSGKPHQVQPVFWLHTKCLPTYLERTLNLLADIFNTADFTNTKRLQEIVRREFAWSEHSAQSEGYNLPTTRVFSHLSKAGYYNELINGVSAYQELKKLSHNYEMHEELLLSGLQELATLVFNRNNLLLSITGEEEEIQTFSKTGQCLAEALPTTALTPVELTPETMHHHEAFITSAEVVFAVQGGNLLQDGQGYNGHFEVLKTYLSREYLWNSVRQMGGAYGCFIQFNHQTGNMALVSYRDPQVKKTYEAYNKIPEVVEKLDISQKVLEQIIIGTYGTFDPHQSPPLKAAAARGEYYSGIDPAYKQQRLKEITSTTVEDLRSFAPSFSHLRENCYRSVIGNRAKIEADKELFDVLTEL